MNSKERREKLIINLKTSNYPIKGIKLAKLYGVTRQVIVKDIAILRAKGENIIATPDGYSLIEKNNRYRDVIVTKHSNEDLKREMEIIVKYGGIIEDVIISHSVYGEITGSIMVKNLNDLNKFLERYNANDTIPLSMLTNGIHMHTISSIDKESMELIKKELKDEGFLV